MPGTIGKTNAGNIALRFRKRAAAVQPETEKALRDAVKAAKDAAIGFSSARAYRPEEDHSRPYSLRNPHPPLPPFLVNMQTGNFRSKWATQVHRVPSGMVATLYNSAKYSRDFDGKPTRKMIGRPILQEVQKVTQKTRQRRMRESVRRALSKR